MSTSLPKSNSKFASQLLSCAYLNAILYFFPFSTSKGILEGSVLQLSYTVNDRLFTNNSKCPVAPHLKTSSSVFDATNSVSNKPEKPVSYTHLTLPTNRE